MNWILETERLRLRELVPEDYGALCLMLRDAETMYAWEHAFSEAEAREWLQRQFDRYAEYGFGLWAVILKETGELIGQCGLTMQDGGNFGRVLEVGYIFTGASGTGAMPRRPPGPARNMPSASWGQKKFSLS